MPTPQQHRIQADHNEFFVSQLENPFWDWAVTGTFYAAVHYIDGYLITKGIDPEFHSERNQYINRDPTLAQLWNDYRELMNNSRWARYDIVEFDKEDVRLLQANLKAIKDVLSPLIPK